MPVRRSASQSPAGTRDSLRDLPVACHSGCHGVGLGFALSSDETVMTRNVLSFAHGRDANMSPGSGRALFLATQARRVVSGYGASHRTRTFENEEDVVVSAGGPRAFLRPIMCITHPASRGTSPVPRCRVDHRRDLPRFVAVDEDRSHRRISSSATWGGNPTT